MLLSGGETSNDETNSSSSALQHQIGLKPGGSHGSSYMENNYGSNPSNLEGRALFALSRFGENARMVSEPVWLHRVQHQQATIEPPGIIF